MATASARALGQEVGNTVRVTVKKVDEGAPVDRTFLVKTVLLDCCGFLAADIYCLQDFPGGGFFDVTFRSAKLCERLLKVFEEKGGEGPLSLLTAVPLFVLPVQRSRVVTVHMYNPHVPAADVLTFLGRYVKVEGDCSNIMDPFGIWTSKRQVRVTLRTSADGNILHPPSSFAVGRSRGYLSYTGQPKVSHTCGRSGHVVADCKVNLCRNYREEGHLAKDCSKEKNCNLCGEMGHLYRVCPRRGSTYAQVTSRGNAGQTPLDERKTPGPCKDTDRPSVQEGQALQEGLKAGGSALQTPLPPENPESMEEAAMGNPGEWTTVRKARRKTRRWALATQPPSGKRHLQGGYKNSSDEGDSEEGHPKQRMKVAGEKESSAPLPGDGGCPEAPANMQPPTAGALAGPPAPKPRATGSSGASGGEPGTACPQPDPQPDVPDSVPAPATPDRDSNPEGGMDGFLSPGSIQQFACTMGMQELTEGLDLGVNGLGEGTAVTGHNG
eukprot:g24480.t1